MTKDVDDAAEWARLAAADLLAAANEVIRRRSITWFNAQTEADFQEVSRIGRYLPIRKADDAPRDVEFAGRVAAEVESLTDSVSAAAPGDGAPAAVEKEAVDRLKALAVECERRAVRLRR
jgi:hypothetical protein